MGLISLTNTNWYAIILILITKLSNGLIELLYYGFYWMIKQIMQEILLKCHFWNYSGLLMYICLWNTNIKWIQKSILLCRYNNFITKNKIIYNNIIFTMLLCMVQCVVPDAFCLIHQSIRVIVQYPTLKLYSQHYLGSKLNWYSR